MDIRLLAQTLHPLERKVFPHLKDTTDFEALVKKSGLQPVEVMRALQWLSNKKLITLSDKIVEVAKLEENGIAYQKDGLPEKRFLSVIDGSCAVSEIEKKALLSRDECAASIGILKNKGFIDVKKEGGGLIIALTPHGREAKKQNFPEEKILAKHFPWIISAITPEEKHTIEVLRQRKKILRVDTIKEVSAHLTELGKGLLKQTFDEDIAEKLTMGMLQSGGWKNTSFRKYDVTINVPPIFGGRRHFVEQSIHYIKRIWLDLGFAEMEGNMVQTAFWDLDALFVPQDHPAREMQDTFYLKDPASGKLPKELASRVKAMHEHGGKLGSTGWKTPWSEEIAKQNLLRTHTTVLSARAIAKLTKEQLPAKFFSVSKVFRNEALSWKHLFEFIQVEGIVVDPDANFKHLKGYLREFFTKMGFEDVRIRPGHFPYTEPSAEVDVFHPIKKIWVELGGAGIFRPEVVEPLLGEPIPVLAWGLGMERSIVEYYGITDIRDVYRNDLKQLRESKLWMK